MNKQIAYICKYLSKRFIKTILHFMNGVIGLVPKNEKFPYRSLLIMIGGVCLAPTSVEIFSSKSR